MNELLKWLIDNFSLIIPYIVGSGGIFAYFLERKKRVIDLKQQDASALQTMQDAYDKFTQDSLKRYEDLKEDHTRLEKKVEIINEKLEKTLSELEVEKALKEAKIKEFDILKNQYDELYEDFVKCQDNFSE